MRSSVVNALRRRLTPRKATPKAAAAGSPIDAPPVDLTKVTRALSIRQPYAEQIMRGTKRVEYRSQPTKIRERVYIYASLTPGDEWDWASMHARPGDFPVGVLVGTVEIVDCAGVPGDYEWRLADAVRLAEPLKPARKAQPTWFIPF